MEEYHFIITNKDFSITFLISPDREHYEDTIKVLDERDEVAYFFVIKGEVVFNNCK